MRRWELVFKALSNINRLKIIRMLKGNKRMNVSEISDALKISFMATSRHLIILRNFEVLQSEGVKNHVVYFINPKLPNDFKKIFKAVY